ncbi:MAG: cation transporter, partial [Bacteroidales bacterium]
DLVAAVITLFAVKVSDKPADKNHHYGHGKVENLSALIETLFRGDRYAARPGITGDSGESRKPDKSCNRNH